MGINHRLLIAFHPEIDGATERMNQELEYYLRCFVIYSQDNWPMLLPIAMLAINARIARSIGISPFFATHGYEIEPIQVADDIQLREQGRSPIARGEAFVAKLRDAIEWAQAMIASAQEEQERYANNRLQPYEQFR